MKEEKHCKRILSKPQMSCWLYSVALTAATVHCMYGARTKRLDKTTGPRPRHIASRPRRDQDVEDFVRDETETSRPRPHPW